MQMEISLPSNTTQGVVAALLLLCLGLGGRGYFVTPQEAGGVVLLTPERWAAIQLARQARQETVTLQKDVAQLSRLLAEERPDPVTAMLLAQGVYARQRTGASATAPARQSAIEAAALAARYAAGTVAYEQTLDAYITAVARLRTLESHGDDLEPQPLSDDVEPTAGGGTQAAPDGSVPAERLPEAAGTAGPADSAPPAR